ncbi:MAG: NAD(P)/FAD-dependent oxidoreductase [Devosia sp.]
MKASADLIVIGAGPAGATAALTAAEAGLSVIVLDEGPAPGGQVARAPQTAAAKAMAPDADKRLGDDVRTALSASSVTMLTDTLVWSVLKGFAVHAISGGAPLFLTAPRLLAATGARERIVPFEGWTLPGVLGLAAATALIKRDGMLPGARIVVAGQGPLLAAVAAKAVGLGKAPVAMVDLHGTAAWAKAALGFAAKPGLAATGARWLAKVRGAGVPTHRRHAVISAEGTDQLEAVRIAPLGDDGRPIIHKARTIPADVLYVGHGLIPNVEVTQALKADHRVDPLRGGLVTVCDDFGRTSVEGLYAAGDGTGVRGARPAVHSGELAGLAAASDAGVLPDGTTGRRARTAISRLRSLRPFADASCRLMAVPEGLVAAITPATIVCRCEDVSRVDIEAAVDAGARDLDQMKHFTRCGMGPCQGRMCAGTAAALVAMKLGRPVGEGFTPRTPLRPVSVADLAGRFAYEDIPVPPPAPL